MNKRIFFLGLGIFFGTAAFVYIFFQSNTPGSCKILTEADCKKVHFGTYFQNQGVTYAAYTLLANTPIFAPFTPSTMITQNFQLPSLTNITESLKGILLAKFYESKNAKIPSKNISYSFLVYPAGTLPAKVSEGQPFWKISPSSSTKTYTLYVTVTSTSMYYQNGLVKSRGKLQDITKQTLSTN